MSSTRLHFCVCLLFNQKEVLRRKRQGWKIDLMDFLTTEFEVFHNFNASKQKGNTVSQHNIEVESEETKAEKHPFF